MRVETPQTAKPSLGDTQPLQVRQHDLACIADDDPLHFTFPIDEDADLPVELAGDLGELAREIVSHELTRR